MRFIALILLLPISIFSQDLTLSISSQESPSCAGESDGVIVLMADGGEPPYVYSIVGGDEQSSSTFDGLLAGDYEFSVTDADGMIAFVSGTVEEGINLSLNINDVDPSCMEASDGQLMISEVNGISGVTYEIAGPASASNMTGIFTDLPIGTYIVSASTSLQCKVVISTTLTSDIECEEDLSLSISSQEDPSCNGVPDGIVTLIADGGVSPYMYGIVGGVEQESGIFQELEAGDYQFVVTDADGNTVEITTTLENEINLSLNIIETDPTCTEATDGQLMVSEANGTSDVTYEISGQATASNSTGIFTDLPVGTYVISASTITECSVEISATLSSDEDCPDEEDPNLCPLLANRIGMQINKVDDDEYSLRMIYQDEVDVIQYVNYTALHEIIHFHLLQRQMNVSLKPDFQFNVFCTDIEALRNDTSGNTANDDQVTSSTQNEINLIQGFILNINKGESLKI